MKANYAKVEVNVDKICDVLEDHKFTLTRDIAMLDNMYQLNIQNFRQLSMYIAAGKKSSKKHAQSSSRSFRQKLSLQDFTRTLRQQTTLLSSATASRKNCTILSSHAQYRCKWLLRSVSFRTTIQ